MANPDSATTAKNAAVAIDVLANDSDPDGDALTLAANTSPMPSTGAAQGTVNCTGGGVCTYTPPGTFAGTVTFGYTVCDNGTTNGADDPKCATATVTVTVSSLILGKTIGFYSNQNGHALLDANGDGRLDASVTIGAGAVGLRSGRSYTVQTIAQSDKILLGDACTPGSPAIFTCTGTRSGQGLSQDLHDSTLDTLAGQTLALTYNVNKISGYSAATQTVFNLNCSAYLTADLSAAPVGLSTTSTVVAVRDAANKLIANSAFGGSITQRQAGAMNSLLGCLNREAW